jgi:periplasmic divalent cation tolerance protein
VFIAYSTVAHREDAERLATEAVSRHLAVCVQIDGPITSFYRCHGRLERAEEFRLAFKCLKSQAAALESQVMTSHPYETPEWVVVEAAYVGEKYLSWANANSSTPPL